MSAFVDAHRDRFGVEPICRTLDVSDSAYYRRETGRRSARSVEHERLTGRIREIHRAKFACYGYRRMHAALVRAGEQVGRDQIARLMRFEGCEGRSGAGSHGGPTISDPAAQWPADLVDRQFAAEGPTGCTSAISRICGAGRAAFILRS